MKRALAIHHATNYIPGIRGCENRAELDRRATNPARIERLVALRDPDLNARQRERIEADYAAACKAQLDCIHETGGIFIYWPPAQGAFPSEETLARWETDYDARPRASEAQLLVDKITADPKALAALRAEVRAPEAVDAPK